MTIAPLSPPTQAADTTLPPRAAERTGTGFPAALDAVSRPVAARGHQSGPLDEMQAFEGFVLRSLVETMLPKDESTFGAGTAGGIWRSMMAERLGEELASGGGVGIADLLREDLAARERIAAARAAPLAR